METNEVNDDYIKILEIIFGLIVAIGLVEVIPTKILSLNEYVFKILPLSLGVIIILVRFFFIPSLNVKPLLNQPTKFGKSIVLMHVPASLLQALLFTLMCYSIGEANNATHAYRASFIFFACLLLVNSATLIVISERIGWERHRSIWIINNILFGCFSMGFGLLFTHPAYWVLWVIFWINSLVDLCLTWEKYYYRPVK